MRIVFMGTPDFSVPVLEALIEHGHKVVGVVTQPDKKQGRKKELTPPPVKAAAEKYGFPIIQPTKVREEAAIKQIKIWNPDAIVVVAFGQILTKEVLDIPPFGCINVHASLLPKYRGAAPIQWAVMNGEKESGITTMYMDEGLDTGDMLLKKVVPIAEKETGGSLHDKLAKAGAELIIETLIQLEKGTLLGEKQEESKSTYVKMLRKTDGWIDFSQSAHSIECLIRGLNPWPSAYTYINGKMLKIWQADVIEGKNAGEPGQVIRAAEDEIIVQTKEGALSLKEVQLEGKKRMHIKDFLRGFLIEEGNKFESKQHSDIH